MACRPGRDRLHRRSHPDAPRVPRGHGDRRPGRPGGTSGPDKTTDIASWTDVPDLGGSITTAAGSNLAITVDGEASTTAGKRMFLRALVDGQPTSPSDVDFADGGYTGTHSFTFVKPGLGTGSHAVQVQWHADPGGTASIGDRTLTLHASPEVANAPLPPYYTLSAVERAIVDLTNQERQKAGLSPLAVNAKLVRAAQIHAADMARLDQMEHTLPGSLAADAGGSAPVRGLLLLVGGLRTSPTTIPTLLGGRGRVDGLAGASGEHPEPQLHRDRRRCGPQQPGPALLLPGLRPAPVSAPPTRPEQTGGYAAVSSIGPGSPFMPGYHRSNVRRRSSFRTCVRTWSNRCGSPVGPARICCFLALTQKEIGVGSFSNVQ